MNLELTDNIITLRPFIQEYAEEHFAGEDEEQVKWLSGGRGSLEGVRKWIEKNQKSWEAGGPVFNFAVFDPESRLVGMVEANKDYEQVEGIQEGDANVSYGLYPFARGKGYATRAVNMMVDFLREEGLNRAVIRVNPENRRSLNVPVRCGFTESGSIVTESGQKLNIFIKDLA